MGFQSHGSLRLRPSVGLDGMKTQASSLTRQGLAKGRGGHDRREHKLVGPGAAIHLE